MRSSVGLWVRRAYAQALLSLSCPCLSPWVSGGWRRSARLLRFHCKSTGGLKEGRRGGGGGGGCMGELALLPCERSSIVPGTFQWLPRGPYPSPLTRHSLSPPQTHKHTHILCPPLNVTQKLFSHSHTLSPSLSPFFVTFIPLGVSLMRPPLPLLSPRFSQADKAPSLLPPPSSCSPPVAHYFASLMWLPCQPDSKSKNMQSSHLHHLHPIPCHKKRSVSKMFMQTAPNQTLLTGFSVHCGSTWWCNFTLCFLLLAWGCWGSQGVASWENRARWGLGWWELATANRSVSFLSWTAAVTWSVITVVSCWDADSTALPLALSVIYCIEDVSSPYCLLSCEIIIHKE